MRAGACAACCSTRMPASRRPRSRTHLEAYRYAGVAAAVDGDRAIARAAGASVTPEAVVVDRAGAVRYRGRIDNLYVDLGRRRHAATVHDLRDAIDAVLAGRPVATPRTEALGCYIPLQPVDRRNRDDVHAPGAGSCGNPGDCALGIHARRLSPAARAVTFSEDVAPILYANCVSCHRPGEAAPFPLISYEDVSTRAKLIAKVTQSRQMPPWHAAHGYGEFADERGLTDAQIATHPRVGGGRACRAAAPRRCRRCRSSPRAGSSGRPISCSRCPRPSRFLPAGRTSIATSSCRPACSRTSGCAPWSSVRARGRSSTTRCFITSAAASAAKLVGADGQPGFGGAMPAGLVPAFAPAGELGALGGRHDAACAAGRPGLAAAEGVGPRPAAAPASDREARNGAGEDRDLLRLRAAGAPDPRAGRPGLFRPAGRHRHSAGREELHHQGQLDAAGRHARRCR